LRVSPGWTLSKLAYLDLQHKWHDHWLRPELEAQRGLLDPDDDFEPDRLYRRHRRLLVAWFQLQEQGRTTLPDDLNTTQRDYVVTSITERIATAANLAETRRRYRQLVRALPSIGALPVLAVPVLAWATTVQPEPAITTPTAIAVDGSLPQPIVVSTSDPRCILNQVRITPSLGTAVPVLPQR
jgi:hypothetical protein